MRLIVVLIVVLIGCSKNILKDEPILLSTVEENKEKVMIPDWNIIPIEHNKIFTDTIYFNFDSYQLDINDIDILNGTINTFMINMYNHIELHGYACPIGNENYNMLLSSQRGFSVKKYMAENGIDYENIEVYPHGENDLICKNKYCYNKNRRCEIRLTK